MYLKINARSFYGTRDMIIKKDLDTVSITSFSQCFKITFGCKVKMKEISMAYSFLLFIIDSSKIPVFSDLVVILHCMTKKNVSREFT